MSVLESTPQGIPVVPPIPMLPQPVDPPTAAQLRMERGLRWIKHPLGSSLLDLEITPSKTLPKHDFLFRLFDKPCFPCGELVTVTGKAKSGKTYFCSSLMKAALRGECLRLRRLSPDPITILWIDTEQSEESTQDIMNSRILQHADDVSTAQLIAINLRSISWDRRMNYIDASFELNQPKLVIFDGIRDVVNDINNGPLAQEVIEHVMQLASTYNCCIVTILHQNKAAEDKTLRGAIGTELQNKSFETYECKKMEDRTFQVEQTATRKYDIYQRLRFAVGEDGLPIELEPGSADGAIESERQEPTVKADYLRTDGLINIERLFRDVFADEKELRSYELKRKTMTLCGLPEPRYLSVLRDALNQGVVHKRMVSFNEVYYSLASVDTQQGLPF